MRPGAIGTAALLAISLMDHFAAAHAQQHSVPLVGIIATSTPMATWRQSGFAQAFLKGLHDRGYEEGRNIAVEYRSAEGNWQRLPAIAAELVGLNVDVLVSATCGAALDAARQATSTVPIVVAVCNDDIGRDRNCRKPCAARGQILRDSRSSRQS